MATTVAGRQLTERQRRQQLAIRAVALRQVIPLWRAFDIMNIDESWLAIEPALMNIIDLHRRQSAERAATYYNAFRMVEGAPGTFRARPPDGEQWIRRARESLRITGPVAAKQAILLNRPNPTQIALTRVSGSVTRFSLEAGRETLVRSIRADGEQQRRTFGFARVGSADPCDFCAMLISRGPVYRSEETASFEAHDHCMCTIEPAFTRDAPRSEQAARFAELWNEAGRGTRSTRQHRLEFRRLLEGRVDPRLDRMLAEGGGF